MRMRALPASHPRVHTLSNLHGVPGQRAVCHAVRVGGGAGTTSVGGLPKVQTELSHGTSGSGTATTSAPSESSHPTPGNFLPQPPPSAYATLLFVTMLWGSYNPTIRFLYDSDHALAPATLTGIRTAIAASALAVAIVVDKVKAQPGDADKQKQQPVVPRNTSPDAPLLSRTFSTVVPAGIELGLYNFLGTSLQAMGLQMTTATRAGFLVQLTAVLVPVLSALAGVPISSRVWVAATLALAGTVLIATDGTNDQPPPPPSTTTPSTPSTTLAPASEVANSSTAFAQVPVDQLASAAILQDGQAIRSMFSAGTVAGTSASIPVHDVTAVATALGGPDRLSDAVMSSKLLPAAVAAATPAVESGSLENSSMLAATTGAVADAAVSAAIATVAVASNTVTATVDALVDAASATSPAVEDTVNAVSTVAGTVAGTVADVAVSAAFGASGAVEGTVASVSSAAGMLVDVATAAAPMVAIGDLYLIAACFSYSLATVRLGFYAPMFSTVELTAVKKFTLGTASAIWLASAIDFQGFNESISQQTPFDWTLVAYSALGPGALATFLQTKGQVSVPPTLAQVVYSLTPVWSAILAFVILGDVGMGPVAWVGSGAILVASGIATSGGSPQEKPAAVDADRPSPVVGQDEPELVDSMKSQSASVDGGSSDGVEVYAAASTSKSPEDVAARVKE